MCCRAATKGLALRYDYAILESHRIVPETCFSQAVKSYFIFKENLNKKYSVVTEIYFLGGILGRMDTSPYINYKDKMSCFFDDKKAPQTMKIMSFAYYIVTSS